MSKKKASDAHVVCGNNSLRCLHCGDEYVYQTPIAIPLYVGLTKGYVNTHKRCKPSAAGKARFTYTTPEEWENSWDTGRSSGTIFYVFKERWPLDNCMHMPGTPYDPDDFGRCYRLLKTAHLWRQSLAKVSERFPEWAPLVEHWDELERLYEEDLPTGSSSRLAARMRELRGEKP